VKFGCTIGSIIVYSPDGRWAYNQPSRPRRSLNVSEIFKKWGEEPKARLIAKAIVTERKKKRIKTTGELVKIIVSKKRFGRIHPATLIFQALRIEVNQELSEIEKMLKAIPEILDKDGRAAFISFHSLEDRMIKNWARNLNKKNLIEIITKHPITASAEELKNNPRSRSAKLRIIKMA